MLLKQWPLGIPCSRGHPEQGKLGNVSSNPYETLRLSPIKGVRARKMLTQNSPYTLWQRLPGLRQLKTSPIPPLSPPLAGQVSSLAAMLQALPPRLEAAIQARGRRGSDTRTRAGENEGGRIDGGR